MSDLVSRIAARAVGATPLVQPRTPALFEEPEAASAEVVEEVVAAPPGSADAAIPEEVVAAPPATAAPGRDGAPPGSPRFPEAAPGTVPPAPPPAAPAGATSGPESDEVPHAPPLAPRWPARDSEATASPVTGSPREAAAMLSEPPSPPPAAAAVAVAPAPAAVSPEASRPGAAPPPRAAAREDAPSVRVHIGRLEVRASLEAARPEPQGGRARQRSDPRLSLSDYLRGVREGR